jgi:hypothetical protein
MEFLWHDHVLTDKEKVARFFYEEIESEEKTISMINPGLFLITTTELALAVVDATVEQQIHSEFQL